MRLALVPLLVPLLATAPGFGSPAAAQTTTLAQAAGINPASGARPDNEIGTGTSPAAAGPAGIIAPQDTSALPAGRLPDPAAGDDAAIRDFLVDARNALAAGRTGEAQEALERAETRALDRSVPLFQTNAAIRDPMVERIRAVLVALGTGDRLEAMRLLEQAMTAAGR